MARFNMINTFSLLTAPHVLVWGWSVGLYLHPCGRVVCSYRVTVENSKAAQKWQIMNDYLHFLALFTSEYGNHDFNTVVPYFKTFGIQRSAT
ncbi:hypothetical protein ACT6QG_06920 [Xanthobacter sp. TB0136]|uniref:hypothetical protein n=1 Tax=Xanthobacter sp. TB0136 TaxID=3459177 RepID=UPI0040399A21